MESFILLCSILLCWAYLCVGQQHTTTLPIRFPSGSNGSQCISHELMQEHRDKLRKTIMDYYNHSTTNSPSTTDSPSTACCTPYSCGSNGTSYSSNTTVGSQIFLLFLLSSMFLWRCWRLDQSSPPQHVRPKPAMSVQLESHHYTS